MKKYLFVFLILLLLTGCNAQNNHSHIQCLECGKCIVEDCIGLEDEKCQGHQPVHTHTQCPEYGKCIAVECDGLKEEKCQGHQPVHTHIQCPECGKCIAKDCDGIEEDKCTGHQHYIYKLTIIDEDNFIYDKPVEINCESDTKIVMHSRPIIDADLAMYINGEFHSIQNTILINDEYVWEYSFIMPERDTTIEFKTQALEYFNVKTILGIPSLTREDILRITEKNINLSSTPESNLIPGSLRIVFSSTDYEDITSMLGFLNRTVVEDRSDNWQDDSGQCNKYSIYTIDKKYDFEITNGYIIVNNKHYKLLGYEPGINYVSITWAFNTNLDSYEAYTLDGTKIGDYNGLSEFEFYEIDGPLTGVDDYGYLETEFGRIYIHDSKTFYIKDGENYTYYKLAWEKEKDFSDICGYGFVTYQDKAEVYWNGTFICEIPMSEIEFVEVDSYVTTEGGIVGEWVLKTEFWELYFLESHIFHFEDNSKTIYKLTGMKLFKLVKKYSNWWVSQNGQPVLLD